MPPKRILGPFDKRSRVVRCQTCATKKIRCAGGRPCEYCARTSQVCREQDTARSKSPFVFLSEDTSDGSSGRREEILSMQMSTSTRSRILDHSFAFLRRNQFVQDPDGLAKAFFPVLETSPFLHSAVAAVGALDTARRGSCRSHLQLDSPRPIAFESYSGAIRELQIALLDQRVIERDDVLWGIFFLGVFELMVDPSGEGFAKHMLFGTSRLLQLAGPQSKMSILRKTFLEVFQELEANRAVLYGNETVLSHQDWMFLPPIQGSRSDGDWDSLGTILSLMVAISTFNIRFFRHAESMLKSGPSGLLIEELGKEGIQIQQDINQWHRDAAARLPRNNHRNSRHHKALIYGHASLIFLANTFDYYPFWNQRSAPRLSQVQIDDRIDSILDQADSILNGSGGSAVFLLYPLRIAGTRANSEAQRARILDTLKRVFESGFVVSDRIKQDLLEYWEYKKRLGLAGRTAEI